MRARRSILERIAAARIRRTLAVMPAEFLLVAACCRWPPSPARRTAIRAAAVEIDWWRLLRIVRRHHVEGLVQHGLTAAEIALPEAIGGELRAKALALAQHNLALAAETMRLQRRFDDDEVPVLFVKGTTLAQLAYGELSLKHSMDIDIVVGPERFEAAKLVVERAGYALIEPLRSLSPAQLDLLQRSRKDWGFQAQATGILVELHWKPSFNPLLLAGVGPDSPVQKVLIGGAQIRTLGYEDLFLYLCVHGARHGWAQLKWLVDLAALLSVRGVRDLEALYRAAERAGAGRCAGQALLLCERFLGLDLPERLAAELQASPLLRLLESFALDAMLGGGAETDFHALRSARHGVSFSVFLLGRSWRHVFYELREHRVAASDLTLLELPASLGWLYPILRLPLWIWRRMGRPRKAPQSVK